MGFSFNGLSGAAITVSGDIQAKVTRSAAATGQTPVIIFYSKNIAGNTAGTIYTVTAGKTLYIESVSLGLSAAGYSRFGASLAGNTIVDGRSATNEIGFSNVSNASYTQFVGGKLSYTAASDIQVMSNAATWITCTMIGWEE